MRKARFDMDITHTLRQCPETRATTLATYLALREIATEAGTCDFIASTDAIKERALVSDSALRKALDIMQRRNIVQRETARGEVSNLLRIRLLKLRVVVKKRRQG